ncbi:hypothetical protein [Patulibacter minatonensis]|uniref:hypothetical protein n=1 Tax=Patulibacter minatonensis TaxID=298163 RepID=UPI0004BC0CE7|nr:hypothetical protein [Patulibacter minatonensis]
MARNVELEYPNREKSASKVMRLVVILSLLGSCAVIAATTIKGWDLMEDAKPLNIAFIALNLIFIVQVVRWSRGVLPMAAGIGAFVAIFAGVSINSWYERDAIGYKDAALSADLGFLTIIILAVQVLVIIVTIVAFSQNWQEEVERTVPDTRSADVRPQGTVPA